MQTHTLFYIIIGILIFDFLLDSILNALNAKHFNDKLPKEKQRDFNEINLLAQKFVKEIGVEKLFKVLKLGGS